MDAIVPQVKGKALIMESYPWSNTQLGCELAKTFQQASLPYSWPRFFVNTVMCSKYTTGGLMDHDSTVYTCVNAVNTKNAQSPVANVGYRQTISGSTVTVETVTKFFKAASGEYYLGIYVMENGIKEPQTGSTDDNHDYVLRGAGTADWGDLVASGSVSAGTTYEKTFTFTLESSWKASNIYLGLIIWKKNGSAYEFVNAYTNHKY